MLWYGGSSDSDIGSMRGGSMGIDSWAKRTDPTLDSVSDLYSELNISSVCASRPSSNSI